MEWFLTFVLLVDRHLPALRQLSTLLDSNETQPEMMTAESEI